MHKVPAMQRLFGEWGRPLRWARGECAVFWTSLAQLLGAGIPLHDALNELMGTPARRSASSGCARALGQRVRGGQAFSDALLALPRHFDRVSIGLVKAGEYSGDLPAVLRDLAAEIQWRDALMQSIYRALSYPALLFVLMCAVVSFLLGWLVPQLAEFLYAESTDLPWATQCLLTVSAWAPSIAGGILLPVGIATGLAAGFVKRSVQWRMRRDWLLLHLPGLGVILRRLLWARLAALIARQYAAGVSIIDALQLSQHAIGNLVVARAIAQARRRIMAGSGLAIGFSGDPLFSELFIRMLRLAERTGRLDTALFCVRDIHQREADALLARFTTYIEPILTVGLGGLLGLILMAVLGPLYDALGATV